jgi:hypothetical protein
VISDYFTIVIGFSLNENKIGDQGVIALAQTLVGNTSLQFLEYALLLFIYLFEFFKYNLLVVLERT